MIFFYIYRMKKVIFPVLGAFLLLLTLSACEKKYPLEDFPWGDGLVDKSRRNQYHEADFYGSWKYQSTQMETWADGVLKESVPVDNVFSFKDFLFQEGGSVSSEGMGGKWTYAYNCVFVRYTIGSEYFYQVDELTSDRMVLRQEMYPVGIDLTVYFSTPGVQHLYYLFTFTKE